VLLVDEILVGLLGEAVRGTWQFVKRNLGRALGRR